MKKMPYIADKKLYAATMFAAKMIRENGYFNKDCRVAANYYGVDEDDVAREVRRRQSVGQKNAAKRTPRKMRWYAVRYAMWSDVGEVMSEKDNYAVVHCYNAKNIGNHLPHGGSFDYEYYACYDHDKDVVECTSEDMAKDRIRAWKAEESARRNEPASPETKAEMDRLRANNGIDPESGLDFSFLAFCGEGK